MSCSYCSYSGYSRSGPPPGPAYPAPIVDGTTSAILDLRKQIKGCDRQVASKARGMYHWSNIQSGADFQKEFDKKYPSLSGFGQESYTQFPYPRQGPPPQRPQSSLLSYSNLPLSPRPQQQQQQQSFQSFQAQRPPQPQPSYQKSSHHHHKHHQNDYSSDSGDEEDRRIRKALQHIDHASRILENY